jgi:hypothetical protein
MKIAHSVALLALPAGLAGMFALAVAARGQEAPEPEAEAPTAKVVDSRDQYALVAEIMDARTRQEPELPAALQAVRSAWHGLRFRWEVALVPALCRSAHDCVAMPFDHLRHPELKIVQGWLPRIELDEPGHAALLRDCKPHRQCVFTFEGELGRFVLDPENPTSIGFTDVEILSVRAASPTESWIRRPRKERALSGNPNVVGRRTSIRVEEG